jgi:hypothetical protein
MQRIFITLATSLFPAVFLHAQTQPPLTPKGPPQTARQALIEMFVGKAPDAFEKHLPDAARKMLISRGENAETSIVKKIAMAGRQMSSSGHFETFDEGSQFFVFEPEGAHEKIEVMLELDSLLGEEEIIELSVHYYQNGEPAFMPVLPRLSFTMKQENEVWKLSEVTLSGRVPLEDMDYLKGVRKQQNEINEKIASGRVRVMVTEELAYAEKHPEKGYICNEADISSQPAEEQSSDQSFSPGPIQIPDESNGYRFSLSGCSGAPATKFQVTAVPVDTESGMKAFCADQSGKLRFVANGKGPECLSRGEILDVQAGNVMSVQE